MKKRVYLLLVIFVILGFFSCKNSGMTETHSERVLLENIKENFKMDFSDIREVGFTWKRSKAGKQAVDIKVKGFMISTDIKIDGDYFLLNEKVKMVSDYLTDRGFAVDIYNTSEIANGYSKDSLVCLIIMILMEGDSESDIYAKLIIECGRI